MKHRKLITEIVETFKRHGMTVEFADDLQWINIRNRKGIHCEFYGGTYGDESGEWLAYTATYTLREKEKDLNYELPYDLNVFVGDVAEILRVNIKKEA